MPQMPFPSRPFPASPPARAASTRVMLSLATAGVLLSMAGGCGKDRGLPEYRELPDVRRESNDPLLDEPGDPPEGVISPTGAELDRVGSNPSGAPAGAPILASDNPVAAADEPAGGFRTVGGVLAEVNGKAIFTDEVIAERRNELRSLARRLPRSQFLREASAVIQQEVGLRLRNEFTLIVFERHTRPAEQELARNLATMWRTRFITDSGGSEAVARRRAREQGFSSLDRMAEEQYRRNLGQIFEQKRLLPQALPSAADIREGYEAALQAGLLTDPDLLNFEVIVVKPSDPTDPTARAQAKVRANALRDRALAGEDFGDLAAAENDDPFYKGSRGKLPEAMIPLERGTYREPLVENAAWDCAEGEIKVVEVPGGDFYVIRVKQNQAGSTRTFDEAQAAIMNELARQSREILMNGYIAEARERLDLPSEEQQLRMLQTAMEVVAQNYDTWRTGK